MMSKKKKWGIALLILLVVLVAVRLSLPYFVTKYVNKVLSEIEGYRGSISDVNLHLYRGAYKIYDLEFVKVEGTEEVPFIEIETIDLSIQWEAIFQGSLVGEVSLEHPKVNFIGSKEGANSEEQSGEDVDWTQPLKDLMPLQINEFKVRNGQLVFYDFSTAPKVDIKIDSLNLTATNLNNASDNKERLPSTVNATATSIGGGKLKVDMKINVLKQIPDFDLDLAFENVHLPALNDFFKAYAKVDLEEGLFSLYSEMIVDDGKITGYVKPILENIKVVNLEKEEEKGLNLVWQSIVGFFAEVFENQPEEQVATRVPIEGDLNNLETGIWPTIWNVFRNAFIEAFRKNTEGTLSFGDQQEEK